MIVITGLGRCGTSILTKYLNEVGFGLGKNINWHDNVRAGYELSTFYTLTHDLYQRFCKVGKPIDLNTECWGDYWKGLTYGEALVQVDKDERQIPVDVVKDPRITWHPDLIKAIWNVRKDIKLIICHRDIQSVYNSRKSLPVQYDDPKPRKVLEEYKQDFADFVTMVLKLHIPHKFLFFPNFLRYFNMTYETLNEYLPHDYDKGKEVWDSIIDKELINGRT
jgi:hypothetical protein